MKRVPTLYVYAEGDGEEDFGEKEKLFSHNRNVLFSRFVGKDRVHGS